MHIYPIKTHAITVQNHDLLTILDAYLPSLTEGTILAITSKIVAICEDRVVKIGTVEKQALVAQEADRLLPTKLNRYRVALTITRGILIPSAGIDESNGDGFYVLWPRDPQRTANAVRAHIRRRFGLARAGVIITDSTVAPLRTGVTGVALAHSSFQALRDYVGSADLCGQALRMTKRNIADSLATAATLVMGEGSEQTPLAVCEQLPSIVWQADDPTPDELQQLQIAAEDDLYGPLLTSIPWRAGQP